MSKKRISKEILPINMPYKKDAYPNGISKLTRDDIKRDLKQVLLHIENKDNIKEDTPYIYERDISSSLFYKLFGDYGDGPLCNPYDTITIPPNVYGPIGKKNKNSFKTTVGLWIYNRWYIERDLFDIFGYINTTIDKKMFNNINTKLSYALLEDKINIRQLKAYLEKTQKIMPFEIILSPNMDEELLGITKKLNVLSKKLFNENKEALDNGDINTSERVLNEIYQYALTLLKDNPSMDNYLSGSGASIDNFKIFFISKGMNFNNTTGEFTMIKSNFIDGISREDYANNAAVLSVGAYSRAKKTADYGYYSKLIMSAYQHIKIGDRDSDCGTKRTVTVNLTNKNINLWIYSYIVEGNRLIELTSDNMDKYIGKTVKFRFSSLCESKDYICNKCAGNLFARRDNKTSIGISCTLISETLKQKALKAFHQTAISTSEMDK